MQFNLAKRHWFNNEATLKALEEAFPQLEQTVELARRRGADISLLVSSDKTKLNDSMKERAASALDKIRKAGWTVKYNDQNQSAASKFVAQLFDRQPYFADSVLSICCLDQYPLFREEHWDAAYSLAEKLFKDRNAYATGARSIPVVLAVNKEASDMRIIHEIIHTIASGEGIYEIKPTPEWANPSKAYEHFGESTSGFYFINPQGKHYSELKKQIDNNQWLTSQPGFPLEYATSIQAGILGTVSTGYVYAEQNQFYTPVSYEEERDRIIKFITREASALKGFPIAPALREAATDTKRLFRLHDYFKPEQVSEVTDLIQKALVQ